MCLDLRRYQQMTANLFVHSDSDVEGLIRRASIPCKAYLQILRDTHADQTEMAKLLFQDVDVANLTVTLTKTNGQRRTVPISIEAVNLILALHNRRYKSDCVFDDVSAILKEFDRLKAVLASEKVLAKSTDEAGSVPQVEQNRRAS